MEIRLGDIGHIIQIAVAPVFLLTGIGSLLGVLTGRLGRIIDRTRKLEEHNDNIASTRFADPGVELSMLYDRARLINRAITLGTVCAVLVCMVVASLFIGGAFGIQLGQWIAFLFVFAMVSLTGSFVYLLREVFIATRYMSHRHLILQNTKDE